jgi:seryl-tRNA synthetase
MKLRFKDREGQNRFCHTLNGSGTALPRLLVALLEQCQDAEGTVHLPAALQPYFGEATI